MIAEANIYINMYLNSSTNLVIQFLKIFCSSIKLLIRKIPGLVKISLLIYFILSPEVKLLEIIFCRELAKFFSCVIVS